MGGLEPPLPPRRPPKEALPGHLGCTSTAAGPSAVCFGAVRSGAVVGKRLGGARARVPPLRLQTGPACGQGTFQVCGQLGTPLA